MFKGHGFMCHTEVNGRACSARVAHLGSRGRPCGVISQSANFEVAMLVPLLGTLSVVLFRNCPGNSSPLVFVFGKSLLLDSLLRVLGSC